MDDLIEQLRGRARFLRDKGRVKSPSLMEQAADTLAAREQALAEARRDAGRYAWLRLCALRVAFNTIAEYSPGYVEGDDDLMDAFIDERLAAIEQEKGK